MTRVVGDRGGMVDAGRRQRPATGRLIRYRDVSGVSGTGHIADLCEWPDGTVSIRWSGLYPSIVHRESIDHVRAVEGHGGATMISWDLPWAVPEDLARVQADITTCAQGEVEQWDHEPMREALWRAVTHLQPLMAELAALRAEVQRLRTTGPGTDLDPCGVIIDPASLPTTDGTR